MQATDIPQAAWILDLEDLEKDTGTLLVRVCRFQRESKSVRHAFKEGDVLYSKLRTYLNKVIVADRDGYSTTEIIPLDFKGFVIAEYARCVLMSNMFLEYTAQCGYGVKMPRLGTNDGKRALFPLPPLSEQRQIMTRINDLISITSELENDKAELYDIVKQTKSKILDLAIRGKLVPQDPNDEPASVLLERIKSEQPESKKKAKNISDNSHYENLPFEIPENWAWCYLEEIATNDLGKTLDKVKNRGEYYPYLRSVNVRWGEINLDDLKEMRFEDKEINQYSIKKGDLLICEGGEAGRCAVWGNEDSILFQNALHRVRFYYNINPYFYMYVLWLFNDLQILEEYTKGVTIKHLTKSSLNMMPLPLPPISEQKKIVDTLNSFYRNMRAILDEL